MRKTSSTACHMAQRTALSMALLCLVGCSLHKAQKAYQEGRYEESARLYREAMHKAPTNLSAKLGYQRASRKASDAYVEKAREARKQGRVDVEKKHMETALALDTSNAVAMSRLVEIEEEARRKQEADARQQDLQEMLEQSSDKALTLINPRSLEGVDLNFQRKTSLKEIFATLSRATGINILLHSSLQDSSVSVDLRDLQFQQILDTLMIQNDLIYTVIDPKTLLISKDTSSNRTKYENQSVQTFYLSYAEPDDVRNVLNNLVTGGGGSSFRVFSDKRQKSLTVRGRMRDLQAAGRIVRQMDKARAEVMIYFELLEVSENALSKVGITPVMNLKDAMDSTGAYRLQVTTKDQNNTGQNQSTGGINIQKSNLKFIFPSLLIDALKKENEAKMMANPNLRVTSDTEGIVNIGQSVPIQTAAAIGGGSIPTTLDSYAKGLPVESFNNEDVSVKIKVKPRVHYNGDISMEIDATIRSLTDAGTTSRPGLGNREIKTHARLRDGETAVFAGLLKESIKNESNGPWGLSDIPFIGKLLSSHNKNGDKKDVILTIKAVVVRKPDIKKHDLEAFDPDFAKAKNGPFVPATSGKGRQVLSSTGNSTLPDSGSATTHQAPLSTFPPSAPPVEATQDEPPPPISTLPEPEPVEGE